MPEHFSPPYYAVIFISTLKQQSDEYQQAATRMVELAQTMPGFLGYQSAREETGITVSFWKDEASIQAWKQQSEHVQTQQLGREQWYAGYEIHIARVERFSKFSAK
jgi:heme-degrading monooxygenase HmoA